MLLYSNSFTEKEKAPPLLKGTKPYILRGTTQIFAFKKRTLLPDNGRFPSLPTVHFYKNKCFSAKPLQSELQQIFHQAAFSQRLPFSVSD